MLISRHKCIEQLMTCQDDHSDRLIKYLVNHPDKEINREIYSYLKKHNIDVPTADHYLLLNNKAHKIIKEVLESEGKDIATYIKIATSLITQATITLEHQFKDNPIGANEFISNTLLAEISQALYLYFNQGDYSELVNVINDVKQDLKVLLDK